MTSSGTARARRGGVDLGGTKIQAVVVGSRNAVLGQARRPTPTAGGPPAIVRAVAETLHEAAQDAGTVPDRLDAVGVGAPGMVDAATGTLARAGNLDGWADPYPLGPALSEALGTPVVVGNDVGVALDAEFELGAGRPYGSVLGVFWGTGVGGGIVLDGRPWHGRGAAAEIGHVVVRPGGARCTCGRRGCLEAYAGRLAMELRARRLVRRGRRTVLFSLARARGRDRLTSGVWERALAKGDPMAAELIDRAVRALGVGIASAVNLLDVDAVILGGGLGLRLGEPCLRRIEDEMRPHVFAGDRPPALLLATLGDLGGAIGASLAARAAARRRSPAPAGGPEPAA